MRRRAGHQGCVGIFDKAVGAAKLEAAGVVDHGRRIGGSRHSRAERDLPRHRGTVRRADNALIQAPLNDDQVIRANS